MNYLAVVAFFACMAATNAGLYQGPSVQILQGPSSKTTLVGPEGSVISAVAPGGQIVHEEHPGFIAHAAPVLAHAAPVFAHATPVVAYSAHDVTHYAPAEAHAVHVAPVIGHAAPSTVVAHSSAYEHNNGVIVADPSGTIATGKAVHSAPVVAHVNPVVAHTIPVASYEASLGHEGEYVHDYSETLYDDGSYKPSVYHH